jgi:hypothetical protein
MKRRRRGNAAAPLFCRSFNPGSAAFASISPLFERDLMKTWLLLIALIALPASAEAMDVATFLAKADPLVKKGMMALFSGDMKLLKGEIQTQSAALRHERLAAEAAGRPQAYCPPPKSGLNVNEMLAAFHSIPAAQQPKVEVKDALRALLVRKYPCRR